MERKDGRFWKKSYDPGIDDLDPALWESTLPECFRKSFSSHPEKAAMAFMGVEISFAELETYSNRFANMLLANGLGKGDVVAIAMANIPEYLLHYRWHSENISQEKNEEQTRQKNILLRPYLEFFMKRALSDDDMVVHTASFRLYRFGSRKEKAPLSLTEQRNWFLLLLKQNKKNPTFNPADMEAFLWSRWIVCCLYRKKPYMIFHFPVKWYLPRVSMQTLRLLMK